MIIENLTPFWKGLLLVLSYGFIGGGLKYIDQVYDIGVFSRKFAIILSPILGLLMGYLIAIDSSSTVILIAIIIGVAIAGKLDNWPFRTVALLSFGVAVFLSITKIIPGYSFELKLVPLFALVLAGVIDEFGNDWADKKVKMRLVAEARGHKSGERFSQRLLEEFFLKRFFMKIIVLFLCILNYFSYVYFFAFFSFDILYILVERYSFAKKSYNISRIPMQTKNNNMRNTGLLTL